MGIERNITLRLVLDDQGTPRLRAFVTEAGRELAQVSAQALQVQQALNGVGAAGEGLGRVTNQAQQAQQALNGIAVAGDGLTRITGQAGQAQQALNGVGAAGALIVATGAATAASTAQAAQGFRDLDGAIAAALEGGSRRFASYDDAVAHATMEVERLAQTENHLADAHVQAYGRSYQAVNNLSNAVDKMMAQTSRWDQPLSQITGVGKAYEAAGRLARQAGELATTGARAAWEGAKTLAGAVSDLTGKVFNLRNAAVGLAAVWLFSNAVKPGLAFNETIESAQIGISSLLTSTMELKDQTGQLLPMEARYAEAKRVSAQETEKLRIAGLSTVATTEQLVEAYQQGVGPLTRAGVALEDVQRITVGIVQAAGALGMPMNQINEEVRSIAEGTINMNSRVAKTLGLTNEMVANWKAQGTLADELNKRLMVFNLASEDAFSSWRGIKSNMAEALGYLMGKATEPLFDSLKAGWKGLLDQVFDIDLKAGKFDISAKFKPTVESLQRIFAGIGSAVEAALATVPDKIAAMTSWWERHGEAVQSILGNTYQAVKGIIEGSLNAVGKVLDLLVPDSGRMDAAETGFRGISSSIGDIAESLGKISTEKLVALAAIYGVSKFVPGGMGKAIAGGAAAGVLLGPAPKDELERLYQQSQELKSDPVAGWWDRLVSNLGLPPFMSHQGLVQARAAQVYQERYGSPNQTGPPAPGDPAWLKLMPTAADSEIGGMGYRSYTLTPKKPELNETQKRKLEDLLPWLEGKEAELRAQTAEWSGDLVTRVQADRDRALAEVEKKLVDLRQAHLTERAEYRQTAAIKDQIRAEYDAKEISAAAEMQTRRVQFAYETGQATRAEVLASLQNQLAAQQRAGQGEADLARKTQKEITQFRLESLRIDEDVLSRQVELHQASKRDLVALYKVQYLEILASDKLSYDEKARLLLDYQKKVRDTNRAIAEDEERVQEFRAELTRDTETKRIIELQRFDRQLADLGVKGLEREQLLELKRQDLHKTGFRRTLEDLADFNQAYDRTTQHMLESTYDGIERSIEAWLDGTKTLGEAIRDSFKQIGIQAAAQFTTAFLVSMAAKGVLSLFPSLGMDFPGMSQAADGQFGLGGALSLVSAGKSAYSLLSGGLGSIGLSSGIGSSLFTFAPQMAPAGFVGPMPGVASGLSGLGAGIAGIGGAISGYLMNQGKGGTAQTVGTLAGGLGAAGGAYGGAAIGTLALPGVGTAIGAALGGLLGGTGGGLLGGLFADEEGPDWAKPGHTDAHMQRLSEVLEGLVEQADKGKLAFGDLNTAFAETAPLAAGAGEYLGGYGDIIGGTLEKLSGMVQGSEEWARVINDELNPAFILQAGAQRDIAAGQDLLTVKQRELNDAILAYAAAGDLQQGQQDQLLDLIINTSGSVADLTDKYARFQEIEKLLGNAHNMERGEVEALGKELQGLYKDLGMANTPMANLTKTVSSFSEAVDKLTQAISHVPASQSWDYSFNVSQNGSPPSYHQGGVVMHSGGWVATAMRHGLLSLDSLPRLHSGDLPPAWPNLRYDEVAAVLKRREFVMREEVVTPDNLPGLRYLNETGQWPANPVPVPVAASAPAVAAPVIHLAVHLEVHGDVVGEAGALERIKTAATEAAQAGVAAALADQSVRQGRRVRQEVLV